MDLLLANTFFGNYRNLCGNSSRNHHFKPYGGNERLDLSIAPTIYLDANGITIKCPTASNGDTGVINGKTYTVNEATLRVKLTMEMLTLIVCVHL